jgi:DNA-binding Xre family transcriptional regulator
MHISCKKLWKILINRDMLKRLASQTGISAASLTKLSQGENMNIEILVKYAPRLTARWTI